MKENITAEQGQKRHDELRGRNTVDVDALPRIVTKPGQTWYNKAGPVTLDELMQKAGALYMQGKKGHGGATDNQQALEPEAGIPWPKRCLVSSPMLKRVACWTSSPRLKVVILRPLRRQRVQAESVCDETTMRWTKLG